jgi:TctA family transporter
MIVYGDWSVFFTRPICVAMLAVTVLIIAFPLITALRQRLIPT